MFQFWVIFQFSVLRVYFTIIKVLPRHTFFAQKKKKNYYNISSGPRPSGVKLQLSVQFCYKYVKSSIKCFFNFVDLIQPIKDYKKPATKPGI